MKRRIPKSKLSEPRSIAKCVMCGDDFEVARSIAFRYSACSAECSTARRQARGIRLKRTCQVCGAIFEILAGNLKGRRTGEYCSNQCRLEALNAKPRSHREGLYSRGLTAKGYIRGAVWRDGRQRWVMEHVYVMEQIVGRRLTQRERVHHINGDRTDNRPENLRLYPSHKAHLLAEHTDMLHRNLELARAAKVQLVSGKNSQSSLA